ncbi:RluA family pseudouridine synthase [Anatilimnocola floriformis]|uniref:RluA family pseudouridine synthase n=1 Tax=Anatilimnocola floriformis TaxID=2948575 RepID=UPI0020C49FC8|nr:RluA family pseudouridine synthase [Anatilimnocola floriformis]
MSQPTRLDRVLRDRFPDWGRQAVQRAIGSGKVRLNSKQVRLSSWEVKNGDQIEVADPPAAKTVAAVQWDDAWIIAEERELIVVSKPAGLLSEPTRFSPAASLLGLAKERFGEVILFHRLDRDTSGLLLLTRPGPINKYLTAAFQNHTVQKEYVAVVARPHRLEESGTIDARLGPHEERRDQMMVVERGGQRAVTRYALEDATDRWQLVRLWPETGRTHQLRVHLTHLGAPILGDRLYGPQPPRANRLHLHSQKIALPAGEGYEPRSFASPLPAGFWPVERQS